MEAGGLIGWSGTFEPSAPSSALSRGQTRRGGTGSPPLGWVAMGSLAAVARSTQHLERSARITSSCDGGDVVGGEVRGPVRRPPPSGAPIAMALAVRPDDRRAPLLLGVVASGLGRCGLPAVPLLVALVLGAPRGGLQLRATRDRADAQPGAGHRPVRVERSAPENVVRSVPKAWRVVSSPSLPPPGCGVEATSLGIGPTHVGRRWAVQTHCSTPDVVTDAPGFE